jgi:predicted phosphodiesterase
VVLALAAGAAAALFGLRWTGSTEADLGPGRVELSARWGDGRTAVALPPLGRVTADTHDAPLAVGARVLTVDVEAAQRTIADADPIAALQEEITDDLPVAFTGFLRHVLLFAAGTGAVAALLLPGRGLWHAVPGAVGGAGAVAALLYATWAPYDLDAFQEPTFEGELARAPGLIAAAERNLRDLDAVRSRVETVSDRLAELYAASLDELPGGAPGETSILHVSDLHLNPLGAELAVELAGDLAVDAILDTGDVTTFGFSIEARFGEILSRAPVPYYVVPGNHDSAQNREQLAALDGITVIDREVVEIAGLRVLGVPDPTFTASNELSTEAANDRKLALADSVADLVEAEEPDLLAVHDARQASQSGGLVPVVVAGHSHRRSEDRLEGTLVLTVGSTGATGLGAFTVDTSLPYEAQVLRFDEDRLVAVDYLTVEGIGGSFTLERRLVDPADAGDEAPDRDDPDAGPDEGTGSAEGSEEETGLGLRVEEGRLGRHPLAAVRGGLDLGHRGRAQQDAGLR